MSYHPNPKDTMLVVDALWTAFSASKDQISTNDPEGRSATLGATMFFGLVLGVVRKMEDRTTMCDAAMGYSLGANEALDHIRDGALAAAKTGAANEGGGMKRDAHDERQLESDSLVFGQQNLSNTRTGSVKLGFE
jgi:hypothetical protein